jgi:hypothetical protein
LLPFRKFVWTGIFLAMLGWAGLYFLVFLTLPTLGPRWLFYFLFTIALAGTSLPFITYLNHRFAADHPVDGNVVIRQSIWIAVYGDLVMWLLPEGVLNLPLALFLAIGFILIELLLRFRESSQWKPKSRGNE